MQCDCLSESEWLLKHEDGCPYFPSHIRTYKSEGVVHSNALHAEQIMCQISSSCHRPPHKPLRFCDLTAPRNMFFVGSKTILVQNNRLLPQQLTAQWTHLGCPGPQQSVFMTATVETCPPKWGLTVWWPSKQGCAITLSHPWKIICWRKFAHILKTSSHLELRAFRANRNNGHFCRGWPARWTNLLLLHRNSLLSCSLELGKLKQPCQGLYSPRAQKQTSSEKRERKKKKATQSFDKQFVFPLWRRQKSQSALSADTAAKMCGLFCCVWICSLDV